MSRNVRQAIPTLGFPTQKAACVALCLKGHTPKQIAALTGASINVVHRSLSEYRKSTGKPTPINKPKKPEPYSRDDQSMWSMDEDQRRLMIIRRAQKGARKTLEAAGL